MKKKTRIKWLMVILWMILIFILSNEPATISDEKSNFVIYIFKFLGINLNSYFGDMANFAVRKTGHVSEYFILFFLLYNALRDKFKISKALMFSLSIQVLYAASDEIHQHFIPGRACRFTDVLIDTCGGLFALLIIKIYTYKKNVK